VDFIQENSGHAPLEKRFDQSMNPKGSEGRMVEREIPSPNRCRAPEEKARFPYAARPGNYYTAIDKGRCSPPRTYRHPQG
jgi:hypothetical protein